MTQPSRRAHIPPTMTQAAYARHKNVSRQTVGKWKSRGQIVMTTNSKGRPRVDVRQSDTLLAGTQNPLKVHNPIPPLSDHPTPTPTSINKVITAREEKERADANMSKLKFEKMAGRLIPVEEIEGIGPAAAALLQQTMTTRRAALARHLSGCKTEREVIAAIQQDDFSLLATFASELQAFDNIPNQLQAQSA